MTEIADLRSFLDAQRAAVRERCTGLDAVQLDTTLAPSTMTLGGMLSHLAYVEDYWLRVVLSDAAPHALWAEVDWRADNDYDWHLAAGLDPDTLLGWYDDAIATSQTVLDAALPAGLDQLAARQRHGDRVSLRWILLHLIEEYARHAGHADLIRESIDGSV